MCHSDGYRQSVWTSRVISSSRIPFWGVSTSEDKNKEKDQSNNGNPWHRQAGVVKLGDCVRPGLNLGLLQVQRVILVSRLYISCRRAVRAALGIPPEPWFMAVSCHCLRVTAKLAGASRQIVVQACWKTLCWRGSTGATWQQWPRKMERNASI